MTTPSSCPCQTGTFEIMETCVSCSLSCQTCAFASTNCSSCATGSFLSSHQCLCNPGYFRNGLACDVCDGSCQTCELTSTTCLSCNPAQGTVLAGSACLCPDGKYKIASGTCQSCNYSCGTCSTGGSTCLSCPAGSNRLLSGGQCTCMSGYYDPGSTVCSICLSPCLTCKGGSVLNCTSCISGYTLIGSFCRAPVSCPRYIFMGECVSVCPNVSYPLGSSCISCPGNCLTCVSSTSCSSCLTPFVLHSNGSCSGSCPSGTY
jgi:proprotein convertase subtilisin/kexin type 5